MPKVVSFNPEKFHTGLKTATKAVSSTYGPRGRNVFLGDPTLPRFTNDGASIADKIILKDQEEDAGAWVVRSATAKTADEVGDGTTTTAILLESMFDEIQKKSEQKVDIKRSLYAALPKVNEEIKKRSHKTTVKDIKHIALVSAEHEELASLVTQIFEEKGAEAQVTVQDSNDTTSSVEMKDGYEAKVGMMHEYLVTNVQKQIAEYHDAPVLCTHKKIDTITQVLPLYEQLSQKGITKLVVVCDDIDGQALGSMVVNKLKSQFNTLVIRATGELLDDIASVVNATVISDNTGVGFDNPHILSMLGQAASVVSTVGTPTTPGRSTFVGKKSSGAKQRATLLERQAELLTNGFEKNAVMKRVAKLRSGVAVLNIGAFSEQERGYLRDKADDAIKAVRSALEEGYVEGGGMCLYRIGQELEADTVGTHILKVALQAPFKKILENAGKDYGEVIKNLKTHGYDAKNDEYKDLVKAGIIDPAKGVRVAVESAVSSIAEAIVTETFITEYVEDKN